MGRKTSKETCGRSCGPPPGGARQLHHLNRFRRSPARNCAIEFLFYLEWIHFGRLNRSLGCAQTNTASDYSNNNKLTQNLAMAHNRRAHAGELRNGRVAGRSCASVGWDRVCSLTLAASMQNAHRLISIIINFAPRNFLVEVCPSSVSGELLRWQLARSPLRLVTARPKRWEQKSRLAGPGERLRVRWTLERELRCSRAV